MAVEGASAIPHPAVFMKRWSVTVVAPWSVDAPSRRKSSRNLNVRLKAPRRLEPLDEMRLEQEIATACQGLSGVSPEAVMRRFAALYDGILLHELGLAQTMAARSLVEQEPNCAYVSARLLLNIAR